VGRWRTALVIALVTTVISATAHSSPFQKASSPQQLTLYVSRGDSYLESGDYKRALDEFRQATKEFPREAGSIERWRLIDAASDRKHYIDIRTADLSERTSNKLWVKMVSTTQGKQLAPTVQEAVSEWRVDCDSKRINIFSITQYDAKGNVVESLDAHGWLTPVPDSIGEVIYNGVCRERE
jgi:hypothetical protein